MPDYLPIACATHELLEFAVLRRQKLRLAWRSEQGDGEFRETVQPLDVETRDGAEWLTVRRGDGSSERVRLDRIVSVHEE